MGPALFLFALAAQVGSSTSAAPQVDLITIGVGPAMYAVYGHAALRVKKPDGQDVAYNFGGVDMKQPGFWTKLMQGRIDAYLEVTPYSQLLLNYSGEDRSITGRTLDLSPAEARVLVEKLDAIAGSNARFYKYHHIFDNCTTRVVHLIDEVMGGQLEAQARYSVEGHHRDWILDRIRDKPWVYLAMDLAGNGQGDVPLVAWDTIFIPEAVDTIVDRALLRGHPLVKARYVDYQSLSYDKNAEHGWPWALVYILLIGPLCLLALFKPRVAAIAWGTIAGLIGMMYVSFWLGSDYDFYHRNWNMLLFPPTHLGLTALALRSKIWSARGPLIDRYLYGHGALIGLLAIASASGLIVQAIGPMLAAAAPVTAALVFGRRRSK